MANVLWKQFPSIDRRLDQLLTYLPNCVVTPNSEINKQVVGLLTNGGKLLRPGFFYIFSQIGPSQDEDKLRSAAAGIELLHVATLIHDDVIDNANMRHGQATLQVDHGNKTAIYAGDLLFTSYFTEVLKAVETHEQIVAANNIMRIILGGELNQLSLNRNETTTVPEYINEIQGKTARLFEFAACLGVELSHGTADQVAKAGEIGLAMGTAYQIRDDILDVTANPMRASKPVQHDLSEGVYTLPLLLAKEQDQAWFNSALQKAGSDDGSTIAAINKRVIDLDGPKAAEAIVQQYTERALTIAQQLPSPVSRQVSELMAGLIGRKA